MGSARAERDGTDEQRLQPKPLPHLQSGAVLHPQSQVHVFSEPQLPCPEQEFGHAASEPVIKSKATNKTKAFTSGIIFIRRPRARIFHEPVAALSWARLSGLPLQFALGGGFEVGSSPTVRLHRLR